MEQIEKARQHRYSISQLINPTNDSIPGYPGHPEINIHPPVLPPTDTRPPKNIQPHNTEVAIWAQRLHIESLELKEKSNMWITSLQTQVSNINSIAVDWQKNVEDWFKKDKDLQKQKDEKGMFILYFNHYLIIYNYKIIYIDVHLTKLLVLKYLDNVSLVANTSLDLFKTTDVKWTLFQAQLEKLNSKNDELINELSKLLSKNEDKILGNLQKIDKRIDEQNNKIDKIFEKFNLQNKLLEDLQLQLKYNHNNNQNMNMINKKLELNLEPEWAKELKSEIIPLKNFILKLVGDSTSELIDKNNISTTTIKEILNENLVGINNEIDDGDITLADHEGKDVVIDKLSPQLLQDTNINIDDPIIEKKAINKRKKKGKRGRKPNPKKYNTNTNTNYMDYEPPLNKRKCIKDRDNTDEDENKDENKKIGINDDIDINIISNEKDTAIKYRNKTRGPILLSDIYDDEFKL